MDAGTPHAAGAGEQVYCLRVVVAGISPLIWRQLDVAGSTTLAELHRILQAAFGWSGEHLHCFTVRGVDYRAYQGEGLPDGKDADGVTLAALGLRVAERFSYDYAFFSNLSSWRHDIRVKAIARRPGHGNASRGALAGPAALPRKAAADRRCSWPCAKNTPLGRPPCAWPS